MMRLVRFLANRRFNFVDVVAVSLAAGSLFDEHWVFGWAVLGVGCVVSLGLEHVAAATSHHRRPHHDRCT